MSRSRPGGAVDALAAPGGEDVLVHVRALAGGLTELFEGDRVTYDVAVTEKGPQARDVQLVSGSAPRTAPPGSARGRSGYPTASAIPVRRGEGVVARYDEDRGFGFITPDAGGADLFVHVSVLLGTESLQEGDRVRYTVRHVRANEDHRPTASNGLSVGACR